MKTAVVLVFWASVSAAGSASVDNDDALVAGFRKMLRDLLRAANGTLSQAYALPEVQEDLTKQDDGWLYMRNGYLGNLQNMSRDGDCIVQMDGQTARATSYVYFEEMPFSYTVATDSRKYPNVTGRVHGELCSIAGKLVVLADMTDTSAVKVRVESFHLEAPKVLMITGNYSEKPGSDFSFDETTAFHEMTRTETTPYLQRHIENLIKTTATGVIFHMDPLTSTASTSAPTTSTATSSKGTTNTPPTTSNSISSSTVPPSKGSTNTPPTTGKSTSSSMVLTNKATTLNPQYPGRENRFTVRGTSEATGFNVQPPSKGSSSKILSPSDNTIPRASERKITPYIVIILTPDGSSEYPPHNRIPCDFTASDMPYSDRETISSTSDPLQEEWLTENFNRLFDILLKEPAGQVSKQSSEFLSLPDDEEELYQLDDGSITLADGDVYGLDEVVLGADPLVERHGEFANATVDVELSKVTYALEFSAKSRSFADRSVVNGTVRGNMAGLRGQLTIVANLTDTSAVTAVLECFQLLPTAELPMDVAFLSSSAGNMTGEIDDAVLRDFRKNVERRLQDRLGRTLRAAIASIQENMVPTTSTPITAPTTAPTTIPPTLTTKPSAATTVAVIHACFLIPWSYILSILLLKLS